MSRLAFCGTPALAVPALRALVEAGHEVTLVVSRPDTRRGRGAHTTPSPVKQAALALGLDVSDDLEQVTSAGAELGVVVAYGRIVPARILDLVPMINVHFSLLPRWRGAAPLERAILAGDARTGVCIMRMEAGLDTGPVLARAELALDDLPLSDVQARLADVGARLVVETLEHGVAGVLAAGEPQQGEVVYAAKLEPEELRIDWKATADEVARLVRLERAWTTCGGRRLRVLQGRVVADDDGKAFSEGPGTLRGTTVRCGAGALELVRVQPEGRRPMSASDWRRGAAVPDGTVLGDPQAHR